MTRRLVRCAIYTRKSTDEGLDQDFNSLVAQREACEAFIQSQKALGWVASTKRYDDGGFSGGSMERPALKDLLVNIEMGKIDLIVVYKVDRLTRSLPDFAKLVELFDTHEVSFVSVTQQFNTTTSMGRLTLNVLLSFAQFEREVTAERIRDKIAASKRKGMWMGGLSPLGYDARNKQLEVNEEEAETVRTLFDLYIELGTVAKLQVEANRLGLRTKRRVQSHGSVIGGKPFTRGHLYQLLQNPLYAGQIVHNGEVFAGKHRAIIDRHTFEQVRQRLADNKRQRSSKTNVDAPSLLTGRAFDETGDRLCPTHTKRKGRRYRYYVSQRLVHRTDKAAEGWRLPAAQLEGLVGKSIAGFLKDERLLIAELGLKGVPLDKLLVILKEAKALADHSERQMEALQKITVRPMELIVELNRPALMKQLNRQKTNNLSQNAGLIRIIMPISLRRRGVETKLVARARQEVQATPDPDLLTLLGQAHSWFGKVQSGKANSARALARELGVDPADLGRTIQLVFLAPDIAEAILAGLQPVELTPRQLKRVGMLPLDWADQRQLLGFPAR